MASQELKTFNATYEWAKTWQELPWSHEEPSLFLAEICRERKPGRALDMGCGSGTDSVYLAAQGWDVTALDFVPKALEYTQERARAAGVTLTPVVADITEWAAPHAYDLVLDHGLLHNVDPHRHAAYRERVMKLIGDDGDFLLLHWHPLYPGQGNGKMGPRRVDREEILDFFAPDLQLRFFALEEFADLPDMVGGGMCQAYYWFRRNQTHRKPAVLLQQIRATLKRHQYDYETALGSDGERPPDAELAPGLMARVLGPGRLGIAHRTPEPAAVEGVLTAWAKHAGVSVRQARNLLTVFASDRHAGICVAGAPRCAQCEVRFCRRLRDP
jgi:SAM-dependent methyltransferase